MAQALECVQDGGFAPRQHGLLLKRTRPRSGVLSRPEGSLGTLTRRREPVNPCFPMAPSTGEQSGAALGNAAVVKSDTVDTALAIRFQAAAWEGDETAVTTYAPGTPRRSPGAHYSILTKKWQKIKKVLNQFKSI